MSQMKSLLEFRSDLKGWKLTALRVNANGRFEDYEPSFLLWIEELKARLSWGHTTSMATHEFEEAERRVFAKNDDLFPDICDRLERTLTLAETAAYNVTTDDFDEFHKICEEDGIDPNEQIAKFIRVHIEARKAR